LKKGFTFCHIHKTKTKKTIKIPNPKKSIGKTKQREKRKPTRKNEINKILN
jgi:hypothetical protein